MIIELSPSVYLALCGLVQDALQHPSDAMPLLSKAAQELAQAAAGDMLPTDLIEYPEQVEALRRVAAFAE